MAEGSRRTPFASWRQAVEAVDRLLADRRPLQALERSAQAVRQFPDSPEMLRRHAGIAEHIIAAEPDHAATCTGIALRCYARAAAMAPADIHAATGQARMLRRLGEDERARAVLATLPEDAAASDDGAAILHAELATEAGLARAAARLDRRLAGGETAALLHARARLLDRAGRHGESFAAARRANGLVAATQARNGLGPGVPTATIDALIAATPAAALRQAPASDRHSDLPVFIVGLPWSGASLVERIVAAHPQAHGAGPRRALARAVAAIDRTGGTAWPAGVADWPADLLAAVHDEYLAMLRQLAPDALRIVDRGPQNHLRLAAIQRLLPGARIVHVQRSPLDAGLSAYYRDDKSALMEPWDLYRTGLRFRDYERLMAHWRRVLDLPILGVQYENLVARPEVEARRIIAFLELPWDDSGLAPGRHPPLHGHSVGRWRRYEQQMEPLIRALAGGPPDEAEADGSG